MQDGLVVVKRALRCSGSAVDLSKVLLSDFVLSVEMVNHLVNLVFVRHDQVYIFQSLNSLEVVCLLFVQIINFGFDALVHHTCVTLLQPSIQNVDLRFHID